MNPFEYERGEGRQKHVWKNDYAGFLPGGRGEIGKCHSSITQEIAEGLLAGGIPEPDPFAAVSNDDNESNEQAYPEKIFAVYRGIPYVAVPTRPGESYHGYPWRGRMSASIERQLAQRAKDSGDDKAFKQWLKNHKGR